MREQTNCSNESDLPESKDLCIIYDHLPESVSIQTITQTLFVCHFIFGTNFD